MTDKQRIAELEAEMARLKRQLTACGGAKVRGRLAGREAS